MLSPVLKKELQTEYNYFSKALRPYAQLKCYA